MDGWLKLYRSILDSAVFQDAEVLKVWIWLLCNVAFEQHDTICYGKVISLKPGQIATGRKKISQCTDLNENKVYRALTALKSLGNIEIKSTNKYSIITVVNWEKYQDENGKRTANEQQTNSKTTAEEQQDNSKRTQHKNGKNGKKEKNIYICSFFQSVWDEYPKKLGKNKVTKAAMEQLEKAGEAAVMGAVRNYAEKIKNEGTEEKYIMHGSTFFNGAWRDYVPNESEPTQSPKKEVELNEAGFPIIDFGLSKYGDF